MTGFVPNEGDLYRPLVVSAGQHLLAGGWCRFTDVEVLTAGASQIVPASAIGHAALSQLTRPRPPVAGLDMARPNIMGILNVTPDSFSDGGRFLDPASALDQAMAMVKDGADILDIGGESTRPGAVEVGVDEELSRTIPVIEAIRAQSDIPISIDTRKAVVGRAALGAGASLVNDVSAFTFDPELAMAAANAGAPACLMHAQGLPDTMQDNPTYGDVVRDVATALVGHVQFAKSKGVASDQIVIDPGIGFGKKLNHNLALLRNLSVLHGLGCPILLGASRKKFIGTLTGADVADDRVMGSVTVALHAVAQGAQIVRVHDVAETRQALSVQVALSQ